MHSPNHPTRSMRQDLLTLACVVTILACATLMSQTTLSTGSIVGTVTDPSGAVVSNAKAVVTNVATG